MSYDVEFLGSIWWLLVALGLLITFHEFGHFWVARRWECAYSNSRLASGADLVAHRGRWSGVCIAVLPLGGFVKMLDEREGRSRRIANYMQAFNRKPVWQRIAIVVAGPAFNLVFTMLAFWIMFMVGIPESRPVLGEVSGIAAASGMQSGDEIVAVDQQETRDLVPRVLGR